MTKRTTALAVGIALLLWTIAVIAPYGESKGALAAPNKGGQTSSPEEKTQETNEASGNTTTVKTCDGRTIELKAEEKRVLDLHNEARKEQGLNSLCVDPTLTKAARAHSKEMIHKGYFSHNSYNGESASARLKRFGYDWQASGENIASGSGSMRRPENRFDAWMKSAGHRKNILDRNFREIGVGSVSGEYKGKGSTTIYTVDFGTRWR